MTSAANTVVNLPSPSNTEQTIDKATTLQFQPVGYFMH